MMGSLVPEFRRLVSRILLAQRGGEWLLSPTWLAFPRSDYIVEQFRDSLSPEQMNKLLQWTVVNENQIALLKLISPPPNPLLPE